MNQWPTGLCYLALGTQLNTLTHELSSHSVGSTMEDRNDLSLTLSAASHCSLTLSATRAHTPSSMGFWSHTTLMHALFQFDHH